MAGRGKSDRTGEILDDWWYDVVGMSGTSRVLDHENLQSGRCRVEDIIGKMFVYRHDLGLSEFGETSSFLIMRDSCVLSERGVWAPLVVGKAQPRLRSFFNGNGQTNLYQCYFHSLS